MNSSRLYITQDFTYAVAHRDYSILGTDIQVKIFDDHLVVESPGMLPGLVRTTNIREMHFSRNPKIAAYMHTYRLVKEFGEGVDRMFREMEAAGQPDPRYKTVEFMVKASIWQHEVMDKVNFDRVGTDSDRVGTDSDPVSDSFDPVDPNSDPVSEVMVKEFLRKFDAEIASQYKMVSARDKAKNACWDIVKCILKDDTVSKDGMSRQTGIKASTLKTLIGHMRRAEIIDFEGVTSDGHWVVKLL